MPFKNALASREAGRSLDIMKQPSVSNNILPNFLVVDKYLTIGLA